MLRLPEEGGTIARDSAAGTVRPGDVLVAVGLNVQTVDGATYNQDVFAAVGPVTCAATPTSAGIACAATSTKVVEFTAAFATFPAAATEFTMTSNLRGTGRGSGMRGRLRLPRC